ncbi:MAG: hypothetical protein JWP89_3742 [Schlesneria sp.]|nr:hypothetical protein [Schlesneria sp.]
MRVALPCRVETWVRHSGFSLAGRHSEVGCALEGRAIWLVYSHWHWLSQSGQPVARHSDFQALRNATLPAAWPILREAVNQGS